MARKTISLIKTAALRISGDLLDLFYPDACSVCGTTLKGEGVCGVCFGSIPFISPDRCIKCGKQLEPWSGECSRCNECRTVHYYFRKTYALCRYGEPVRKMIRGFKYGKDFSLVPAFRRIIRGGIPFHGITGYECVVPVPLHVTDRVRRGFNQSALFAEYASAIMDTPFLRVLRKKHRTHTQVSLSRAQRKKNLKGAFTCSKNSLSGKTVLLVDDVFTTGSTLSECAETLRKQGGASRVDTLVIAR